MKALCGLVYKYAIPRHHLYDNLNVWQYLKVSGESGSKEGLPPEALDLIKKRVGTVFGAEQILCQCYLGFRPAEFIVLDAASYNREEKAFVGGIKTDAGKNRTVTVSPKIQPYVDKLLRGKSDGEVFPDNDGNDLNIKKYRQLFYAVLEQCGIGNPIIIFDGVEYHRYTPHSCRHTFATLMKRVARADKDKLELIGHTSAEMLRHYQDVNLDNLRKITNAL